MREKELEDRSWVPMPGVPWRVVVRVHPARVPDVVRVHALCSRLHRPTLVARPSRLSIVSRASVDGLNVDQMAPLRLALTLYRGTVRCGCARDIFVTV